MRPLAWLPGLVVAAVLLTGPPAASAQGVEVGVFGGLGFGGALLSQASYEEVPLEAGFLYGATAAVEFLPGWRVEALVMQQKSRVHGPAHGASIEVNIERYLAGVRQQEHLSGRFDIFGEFMLGATRFAPKGYESETWFTLGAGAGVKTSVTAHVGFRFEARGHYTPVSISGRVFCGGYGCLVDYTGLGMFQGDVSAGVFFAF